MAEVPIREDSPSEDPRSPLAARGSFIVDAHATVLAFDERMEALTGWRAVEVVGRPKDFIGVFHGDSRGLDTASPRPLYEGSLPSSLPPRGIELRLHCYDGRILDVEASGKQLGGAGGRLIVWVTRVLARSERPMPASAQDHRDRLTGLGDQAAFRSRLDREVRAAAVSGKPLALILADVDHLRRINDKLGRAAGDEVLRKIAGILRAAVEDDDQVARLGDDDFASLLIGAGRGEARQFAAQLRSNMEQTRFLCGRVGAESIRATLSIGSASFPTDADGDVDLVDRAREALAEARALGRNRVWCYTRRARVPLKTPVYFDGAEPLIVGFSRDLSPSGIFIQTPTPIDAGMRCALAFPLPGTEDNVHVIGRVVRSVPPEAAAASAEESIPGMAVEFERFEAEDRKTIESFLHTASRRTRGAIGKTA